MKQSYLLKNITGTVCVVGIALSTLNVNSTMLIDGHDMEKVNKGLYCEANSSLLNGIKLDNVSNIYMQNEKNSIEKEAQELFGNMRDATKEEQKSVRNYINKISKDTGVNFFDLC